MMKKFISSVIAFAMLVSTITGINVAIAAENGAGTVEDPYVVSTAAELANATKTGYIQLGADITDASTTVEVLEGTELTLDLNGHTLQTTSGTGIQVNTNAGLELKGPGTIVSTNTAQTAYVIALKATGGHAKISGVSLKGTQGVYVTGKNVVADIENTTIEANYGVNAGANAVANLKNVDITCKKVSTGVTKSISALSASTGTINVDGGTYTNTDGDVFRSAAGIINIARGTFSANPQGTYGGLTINIIEGTVTDNGDGTWTVTSDEPSDPDEPSDSDEPLEETSTKTVVAKDALIGSGVKDYSVGGGKRSVITSAISGRDDTVVFYNNGGSLSDEYGAFDTGTKVAKGDYIDVTLQIYNNNIKGDGTEQVSMYVFDDEAYSELIETYKTKPVTDYWSSFRSTYADYYVAGSETNLVYPGATPFNATISTDDVERAGNLVVLVGLCNKESGKSQFYVGDITIERGTDRPAPPPEPIRNGIKITSNEGKLAVTGKFDGSELIGSSYKVIIAVYGDDETLIEVDLSEEQEITERLNTVDFQSEIGETDKLAKAFLWADGIIPICEAAQTKTLKVLAIGNSFSVDAMEWLYNIAESYGYEDIVLGNAYIAGARIETHKKNSVSNSAAYVYYKNTTGEWTTENSKTLEHCITDEEWDLITLQQGSADSGMPDTYEPHLTDLINYVNETKTNPDADLAWHMTWAYAQNSTHQAFPNYNNDQMTMYNAIVDTYIEKVLPKEEIAFNIPVGTAIQNVRTSFIGDTLTRDGYHLSAQLGRYIAGLTWFAKITGLPIDDISYVPSTTQIPPNYLEVVKECVNNAIENPYEVTQSQYTTTN